MTKHGTMPVLRAVGRATLSAWRDITDVHTLPILCIRSRGTELKSHEAHVSETSMAWVALGMCDCGSLHNGLRSQELG